MAVGDSPEVGNSFRGDSAVQNFVAMRIIALLQYVTFGFGRNREFLLSLRYKQGDLGARVDDDPHASLPKPNRETMHAHATKNTSDARS